MQAFQMSSVTALAALTCALASAQTEAPLFPNAEYLVGDKPWSLVTGDLDGDGRLDLVTANEISGDVTVLIANGLGGFHEGVNYFAGGLARAVAIGDVDEDGVPDLVVACTLSNSVAVLHGTGGGTFAFPSAYLVGQVPYAIALGDFDNDGHLDLVTADSGSNSVTARFGDGQGAFGPAVRSIVGTDPRSMGVGDFDGDGYLDVVTANYGSFISGISVLLNTHARSFAPASHYNVSSSLLSLRVGDLNADGNLDVAMVFWMGSVSIVMHGNGQGGFEAPLYYPLGPNTLCVAIGDLNNDGVNDLVGIHVHPPTLKIRWGTSSGTLVAGPSIPIGDENWTAVLGDFNQDGRVDIATSQPFSDNVCVLLRDLTGSFVVPARTPVPSGPSNVAVGDLNNDGRADVAVSRVHGNDVQVLIGDGQGGFVPGSGGNYPVGANPESVVLGDLDHDGWVDMVTGNINSQNVSILRGIGNGVFSPSIYLRTGGLAPRDVTLADVNADGWIDIISANTNTNNVTVFLATTQGNFGVGTRFMTGTSPSSVSVGDFNGDGNKDIATADILSNTLSILIGNGQGVFQSPQPLAISAKPIWVISADLNEDGRDDLLATSLITLEADAVISVLLQDSQGQLQLSSIHGAGRLTWRLAVSDLDGDGHLDVAAAEQNSNNVAVFLGDGQGGLSYRTCYMNPPTSSCLDPQDVAVGDLNGDGRPDLVTSNSCADSVLVHLNVLSSLPGSSICHGDGVGGICPCGNPGLPGHGCENSSSTGGALLESSGGASLASDTLVLASSGELAGSLSIFLQGSSFHSHVTFGDGLRCAGATLQRLFVRNASSGVVSVPQAGDLSISALSSILGDTLSPGSIRVYQTFYRDTDLNYCPFPTGSSFNISNGQQVVWQP